MFDPQQIINNLLGSVAYFERTECLETKHRIPAHKNRLGALDRLRGQLQMMTNYPQWYDLATQLLQAMNNCDRWQIRLQSTQTSSGLGSYDYRLDAEQKHAAENRFIELALMLLQQLERVSSDC